jgi:hypothetical protein
MEGGNQELKCPITNETIDDNQDFSNLSISEQIKMVDTKESNGEKGDLKSNIMKYIALIKVMSTMRIMKEDKEPIEIIDNIFIGSLGAASNKESLINNKITHILCAASSLKKYFPDVSNLIKNLIIRISNI